MVAVASSFVAVPGRALADANEVSISPTAVEVAPGGSVTVQLIAEPPAETLAVWAIDVLFDSDIVTTSSLNCDTLDPPPDSTSVGLCVVSDEGNDGVDETVTALGGIVFNDSGDGLSERTVLADITFEIVGNQGQCSDLRVAASIFVDSAGNPTDPLVFDGLICVEQDAPPSGTAVPHTPAARTSEPTSTGGGGLTPPPLDGDTPSEGDETPTNGGGQGSVASQGSGASQGTSPTGSASQTSVGGEGGPASVTGGGDSDDDDGGGVLIWVLLILAGLIAAAGVAWAVVRRRGDASGPEDGPSAG
jgi:hypothetical protein